MTNSGDGDASSESSGTGRVLSKHDFAATTSQYRRDRMSDLKQEEKRIEYDLTELYAGVAIDNVSEDEVSIGIAIHDGTYSIDFGVHVISSLSKSKEKRAKAIEDLIVDKLDSYRHHACCKLMGVGIGPEVYKQCPGVPSRMWAELDIVPWVLQIGIDLDTDEMKEIHGEEGWAVDEKADSLVRKCILMFGPTKQPRLVIGYENDVQVDSKGRIKLCTEEQYKASVREPTWNAVMKYVKEVKDRKLRIVFINATPQGGGVALMRHALIRFLKPLGVNIEWFVPRPRPDVFRVTKTNHNILQGTVGPDVSQSDEDLQKIEDWVTNNAERYWLKKGGPLSARADGGADILIIDDPQMPGLIPLAKKADKDRPVVFRSHIEVRDDLVQKEGSSAAKVWKSIWKGVKEADLFISHPVKEFVPDDVEKTHCAYLPATTDWLDGLNKNMQDYDIDFYLNNFNKECSAQGMPHLAYPKKSYICQIARFDPAKGIPDVIKSFAIFRRDLFKGKSEEAPQLVICGHSSVDDPDGSMVFDQTLKLIHKDYEELKDDIIIARLGPSDQLLNAVITKAHIVLQLSTREGFEIKVSEALHKGKPVITTRTGGIPLQVHDGKNGMIVEPGDVESVAKHIHALWTDEELYKRMSEFAKHNVSDEVSTVGNALSWLYLASVMTDDKRKKDFEPNLRWVNDMAREEANEPYGDDEPRVWRHLTT